MVSAFHRTGEAELNVVAAVKCSIARKGGKEIVRRCGNTVWSHTSMAGALDVAGVGRDDTAAARKLILSYPGLEAKDVCIRMRRRREGRRKTTKQEILN